MRLSHFPDLLDLLIMRVHNDLFMQREFRHIHTQVLIRKSLPSPLVEYCSTQSGFLMCDPRDTPPTSPTLVVAPFDMGLVHASVLYCRTLVVILKMPVP